MAVPYEQRLKDRERNRRRREAAKAEGICSSCIKRPRQAGKSTCRQCTARRANRAEA